MRLSLDNIKQYNTLSYNNPNMQSLLSPHGPIIKKKASNAKEKDSQKDHSIQKSQQQQSQQQQQQQHQKNSSGKYQMNIRQSLQNLNNSLKNFNNTSSSLNANNSAQKSQKSQNNSSTYYLGKQQSSDTNQNIAEIYNITNNKEQFFKTAQVKLTQKQSELNSSQQNTTKNQAYFKNTQDLKKKITDLEKQAYQYLKKRKQMNSPQNFTKKTSKSKEKEKNEYFPSPKKSSSLKPQHFHNHQPKSSSSTKANQNFNSNNLSPKNRNPNKKNEIIDIAIKQIANRKSLDFNSSSKSTQNSEQKGKFQNQELRNQIKEQLNLIKPPSTIQVPQSVTTKSNFQNFSQNNIKTSFSKQKNPSNSSNARFEKSQQGQVKHSKNQSQNSLYGTINNTFNNTSAKNIVANSSSSALMSSSNKSSRNNKHAQKESTSDRAMDYYTSSLKKLQNFYSQNSPKHHELQKPYSNIAVKKESSPKQINKKNSLSNPKNIYQQPMHSSDKDRFQTKTTNKNTNFLYLEKANKLIQQKYEKSSKNQSQKFQKGPQIKVIPVEKQPKKIKNGSKKASSHKKGDISPTTQKHRHSFQIMPSFLSKQIQDQQQLTDRACSSNYSINVNAYDKNQNSLLSSNNNNKNNNTFSQQHNSKSIYQEEKSLSPQIKDLSFQEDNFSSCKSDQIHKNDILILNNDEDILENDDNSLNQQFQQYNKKLFNQLIISPSCQSLSSDQQQLQRQYQSQQNNINIIQDDSIQQETDIKQEFEYNYASNNVNSAFQKQNQSFSQLKQYSSCQIPSENYYYNKSDNMLDMASPENPKFLKMFQSVPDPDQEPQHETSLNNINNNIQNQNLINGSFNQNDSFSNQNQQQQQQQLQEQQQQVIKILPPVISKIDEQKNCQKVHQSLSLSKQEQRKKLNDSFGTNSFHNKSQVTNDLEEKHDFLSNSNSLSNNPNNHSNFQSNPTTNKKSFDMKDMSQNDENNKFSNLDCSFSDNANSNNQAILQQTTDLTGGSFGNLPEQLNNNEKLNENTSDNKSIDNTSNLNINSNSTSLLTQKQSVQNQNVFGYFSQSQSPEQKNNIETPIENNPTFSNNEFENDNQINQNKLFNNDKSVNNNNNDNQSFKQNNEIPANLSFSQDNNNSNNNNVIVLNQSFSQENNVIVLNQSFSNNNIENNNLGNSSFSNNEIAVSNKDQVNQSFSQNQNQIHIDGNQSFSQENVIQANESFSVKENIVNQSFSNNENIILANQSFSDNSANNQIQNQDTIQLSSKKESVWNCESFSNIDQVVIDDSKQNQEPAQKNNFVNDSFCNNNNNEYNQNQNQDCPSFNNINNNTENPNEDNKINNKQSFSFEQSNDQIQSEIKPDTTYLNFKKPSSNLQSKNDPINKEQQYKEQFNINLNSQSQQLYGMILKFKQYQNQQKMINEQHIEKQNQMQQQLENYQKIIQEKDKEIDNLKKQTNDFKNTQLQDQIPF